MSVAGNPHTLIECDELIDRVVRCRDEARTMRNRALVIDLEDRLCELNALRGALIPEQRQP